MDLDVAGRAYVITGGSRGLGYATASVLSQEGARTVLVARGEADLEQAKAALGPRTSVLAADLARPETAASVASMAGLIDGVLVNVGGPAPGALLELGDAEWLDAFQSVFLSSMRLLRALIPQVRDGGSILIVLSSTAKEPIHALGASNGLRPGLGMTVKDLADTLAPRVRVNGIMPGRIATQRLSALTADFADGIPLGRPGDPAEFGRVAAFLLSPAASYVTGALIPVDGGLLRSPW